MKVYSSVSVGCTHGGQRKPHSKEFQPNVLAIAQALEPDSHIFEPCFCILPTTWPQASFLSLRLFTCKMGIHKWKVTHGNVLRINLVNLMYSQSSKNIRVSIFSNEADSKAGVEKFGNHRCQEIVCK